MSQRNGCALKNERRQKTTAGVKRKKQSSILSHFRPSPSEKSTAKTAAFVCGEDEEDRRREGMKFASGFLHRKIVSEKVTEEEAKPNATISDPTSRRTTVRAALAAPKACFPLFQKKNVMQQSSEGAQLEDNGQPTSHPNYKQATRLRQIIVGQVTVDRMREKQSVATSSGVQHKLYSLTKDGSSWILHFPSYYPCPSKEEFDLVWDAHPSERKSLGHIFGRPAFENRYTQSYGVTYSYSNYKEGHALPIDSMFSVTDLIQKVNHVINKADFGWGPFNGCLMNWYVTSL
jgi:hypothetical protein